MKFKFDASFLQKNFLLEFFPSAQDIIIKLMITWYITDNFQFRIFRK